MGIIERFKDAIYDGLEKRLEEHRAKSMITCAGNCWCWTIESWLTKRELNKKKVVDDGNEEEE